MHELMMFAPMIVDPALLKQSANDPIGIGFHQQQSKSEHIDQSRNPSLKPMTTLKCI
jgi:hypothetical protein